MKQSRLFPCYSIPMRDYLAKKGIRYELTGMNPVTQRVFWVYVKDKKLIEAMKEWTSNKQRMID